MNAEEIKNKLLTPDYDFLRQDKHLGKNIILLTTGGSHAYGTNVETSDLDIRGITMENPSEIIGLQNFEQFENKATDTTVFGFSKFISLASNCNPNVMEMFGTKDEHLFVYSEYGRIIRENIGFFLSRRVIHTFGGYAIAQLRRLENALARDSHPQPKKEEHILNSIKYIFERFKDYYQKVTSANINLFIDKSNKIDYETEIFMDVNLKHYPLRDFKNIYSEMSNVIDSYNSIGHRNNKKDDLHLNKHAMHLIRLYLMGIEILEGKGINTFRENDIEFLLDIRHGKYSPNNNFDAIFEMVNDYQKKFEYAQANSSLPEKPNYKRIEELVMAVYMDWLFT